MDGSFLAPYNNIFRSSPLNHLPLYLNKLLNRQLPVKVLVHLSENLLSPLLWSGFILRHLHNGPNLEDRSVVSFTTSLDSVLCNFTSE